MLHRLYILFADPLEASPFDFLRVFTFTTFTAMLATLLAFVLVLALGGPTIRWLKRRKIGDNPDFDDAAMNAAMADKRNTPTMGGLLIVAAITGVTLLLADIGNFYVQMSLVCLLWLGGIGAVDDWLKLNAESRAAGRDGLKEREKLLLQFGLAFILGYFLWKHGLHTPAGTQLFVPFLKGFSIDLPLWLFVIWSGLVIVGCTNAVNLTDGLDGLASGCVALVAIVLLVMTLIISDGGLARDLLFHHIAGVGPLAVVCGAILGASLGFLWFNCHPASVFMGDTGSLALGGLLAFVALAIRQELLLAIVGGVFVVEAASSRMQKYYFKYHRIRHGQGKKLFLMAPIHHHFQKVGWSETQIVVRFWLIGAVLAAAALATVKLR